MDKAVALQQQRMRDRAGTDDVVYEYAYDEPECRASAEMAVKMAQLALTERQKLKGMSDEGARKEILKNGVPALQLFSRTHPSAFRLVTEAVRGAEHFTVFSKLARLRQAVDDSGASEAEATAFANEMLQSQCAKGPAPSAPEAS